MFISATSLDIAISLLNSTAIAYFFLFSISRSVINSRLKNSQSHESLLTSNSTTTMHSIDLTSNDVEIKPLHRSILSQDHCFQIATSHGSKYISCRTVEEREKWIERFVYVSLGVGKPVLEVSDQVQCKPCCTATEDG